MLCTLGVGNCMPRVGNIKVFSRSRGCGAARRADAARVIPVPAADPAVRGGVGRRAAVAGAHRGPKWVRHTEVKWLARTAIRYCEGRPGVRAAALSCGERGAQPTLAIQPHKRLCDTSYRMASLLLVNRVHLARSIRLVTRCGGLCQRAPEPCSYRSDDVPRIALSATSDKQLIGDLSQQPGVPRHAGDSAPPAGVSAGIARGEVR